MRLRPYSNARFYLSLARTRNRVVSDKIFLPCCFWSRIDLKLIKRSIDMSDTTSKDRASQNHTIIAKHNDMFRRNFGLDVQDEQEITGVYLFSQGVQALSNEERLEIILKVRSFDNFNKGNDPYGEHDFGSFKLDNRNLTIFWKIDYFDTNFEYGCSPNPSNAFDIKRTLTVMLAREY
jgi:hypothetical protein